MKLMAYLLIALGTVELGVTAQRPSVAPAAQRAGVPQLEGTLVEIDVRTALSSAGGSSDLILIIFSHQSADAPVSPVPLFGEDILAEFAFSARDVPPGQTLTIRRRVKDLSFLDARFIRVVNPGSNGWAGEKLSLRVAGKTLLDVSLYPRKGAQPKGGIEKFNGLDWKARNFWEADLQRLRQDKF
jgi:hypothetical protein